MRRTNYEGSSVAVRPIANRTLLWPGSLSGHRATGMSEVPESGLWCWLVVLASGAGFWCWLLVLTPGADFWCRPSAESRFFVPRQSDNGDNVRNGSRRAAVARGSCGRGRTRSELAACNGCRSEVEQLSDPLIL